MRTSAPHVAATPSIPQGRDDGRPRTLPGIRQVRPTRIPALFRPRSISRIRGSLRAPDFRPPPHYPDLLAALRVYM
jgi:hypothetical protein